VKCENQKYVVFFSIYIFLKVLHVSTLTTNSTKISTSNSENMFSDEKELKNTKHKK
jgi:uncharacterized ubiquitin-like protein YukD